MPKTYFPRLSASLAVISAVLGLFIALSGLVVLWTTKDSVTRQVNEMITLTGRMLSATRQTINVTGRTLDQASGDLDMITQMVDDLGGTLDDSSALISSTGKLVGEDMVDFVSDTRAALGTVESSTRLVDDFLRIISSVPFLGSRYRPDVPLQESVARVSESLEPLPEAFLKIQGDLETASANADTLNGEVRALGDQIADIQTSVSEARLVVEEYETILADVQTRFDRIQARINRWMAIVYAALTIFLAWMLLSQISALMQVLALYAAFSTPSSRPPSPTSREGGAEKSGYR